MAFSVVDLAATERWFREGLGFLPAGGSRRMMRGPLASAVQGLPRVASTCWWMVDRNEFFQLELFQFERPAARLMAHDARPCDIGYTRIGVWVADFDLTLTRLEQLGSSPLSDPVGPAGARRACVRNPDGVYVEIMEDDPLAGAGFAPSRSACPVAVRSVTLSVPDLARSEAFFSRGLGLERSDAALRSPEHESLWGLDGARDLQAACSSPGSVLVEIVEYLDPVGRPRPVGLPDLGPGHPQHRLRRSQQARSLRRSIVAHARLGRGRTAGRCTLPGAGVVYVNDPEQFSVELLWISPASDKRWGFTPRPTDRRPRADTHAIEQTVRIAAPVKTTWDVIADQERMGSWIGLGSVSRTVDGAPDLDGRGSERLLKLPGARVCEQVVGLRRADGVPLPRDQGVAVRPATRARSGCAPTANRPSSPGGSASGRSCRGPAACWRSSSPGCSRYVLRSGLKPHVEARHTTKPIGRPSQ